MSSIPDRIREIPPSNVRNRQDSSSDDDPRFDQSRKEWPDVLTQDAIACVCEHYDQYGVTPEDVYNVEAHFDGEYAQDDALRLLHIIDYSGLDLKVDCSQKTVDVALRIRPTNPDYDVDFSFRVENGINGKAAEYDKWLNALDGGDGYYPGVIAFGVANADEDAFEEFHLIKTHSFLKAIDDGTLNGEGPKPSPGGAQALYYPVDDLRDAGCILQSWGGSA